MEREGREDEPTVEDLSEWRLSDEAVREFVLGGVQGISSLVRTSYGPHGGNTLVETVTTEGDPELVLTADSAELFAAIERGDGFNHPIAALLVDAVDSIHRSLSDGGTTTTILAEELIRRGFECVERGLHPNSVTVGYAMAATQAGEVLDELARPVETGDEATLKAVAATAMCDELEASTRDRYARTIASVVSRLGRSDDGFVDTEMVKIVGTTHHETRVYDGVVVRQWPRGAETFEESNVEFDWSPIAPDGMEDVRVAVVDGDIDPEETATNLTSGMGSAGVKLTKREGIDRYRAELENYLADAARRVRSIGTDLLVARESLEPAVVDALEAAGVAVLDDVSTPEVDVHRIASLSGATVVSELKDIDEGQLGIVGTVSGDRVGNEKWTVVENGNEGRVFTVVAGTKTESGAERAERIVSDALDVAAVAAMDGQVLPGAGAPAFAVAAELRSHAPSIEGVEQLAVERFADALEAVGTTLAENAGHDGVDVRTAMRSQHAGADGPLPFGVDLDAGNPVDAYDAGILEPRRVFSQAIETARSVTEHLLTTDTVYHPGVDLSEISPQTEHR